MTFSHGAAPAGAGHAGGPPYGASRGVGRPRNGPPGRIRIVRQRPIRPIAAALEWLLVVYLVVSGGPGGGDVQALILLGVAGWVYGEWEQWRQCRLTITGSRVVYRWGLLRTERSVPLSRVSAVEYERDLPGMTLGYGTLVLTHTGGQIRMTLVPDVVDVARFVDGRLGP